MNKKCKLISIWSLAVWWIILPIISHASVDDNFPDTMVGQAYIETGSGDVYYGGMTGNETVLNYIPDGHIASSSGNSMKISSTLGARVTIPNVTNIGAAGADFSAMAWVKPSVTPANNTYETIISAGREASYGGGNTGTAITKGWALGLHYVDATSGWELVVSMGDGTNGFAPRRQLITYGNLSDGNWHHLAFCWDYSAGEISAYFDQTEVISQMQTNPNTLGRTAGVNDNASGFRIGSPTNQSTGFIGSVDEVRLYFGTLTALELQSSGVIANAEKTDFVTGLGRGIDLRLTFNDSDADKQHTPLPQTQDVSDNAQTGTVYAGATWDANVGDSLANLSDENFGFERQRLIQCVGGIILGTTPNQCFIKNSNTTTRSMNVMNSRTFVNNNPALETAVIKYPDFSVMGDVHGLESSLDNFAFWGRNLHQGNGTLPNSDASWVTQGPMNPNAQAKWNGTEFAKYIDKIKTMVGEGIAIANSTPFGSGTPWVLDNTSSSLAVGIGNINPNAANMYPQGRVWTADCKATAWCNTTSPVQITTHDIIYYGKGTIVVKGADLVIGSGINIKAGDANARLGIIVIDGKITIQGNNNIDAVMLAYDDPAVTPSGSPTGQIQIAGSNIIMTGSFVANDFSLGETQNIRFYYDYDLDSAWPPGFKDLKMPKAN